MRESEGAATTWGSVSLKGALSFDVTLFFYFFVCGIGFHTEQSKGGGGVKAPLLEKAH